MKIRKKKEIDANVYDTALERINSLYDRFDKVVVSFSGGKDSTVCLMLTLEVARKRGKLPLDVYFWDEEAIHPETVDYVQRVSEWEDVRFKWLCVPIKHRNACSRNSPYWYPWEPDKKELWVRPFPATGIPMIEGFYHGAGVPDIAHRVYDRSEGTVADIRGLRASESLRRYRAVAMRKHDNWIGSLREGYSAGVSPIYDWTDDDVWLAPKLFGWDYNRAYDVMDKAGVSKHAQRVCPPYGEEPLGGLYQYAQCWPELWNKMIARVPGATTAARYARTELYGYGKVELPDGKTWKTWLFDILSMYGASERAEIAKAIIRVEKDQRRKTGRPIPYEEPDPVTGNSWKSFCIIAIRGDLKGRRIELLNSAGSLRREREGLSMKDAVLMDIDEGTRL